jgi:hypothetical protein
MAENSIDRAVNELNGLNALLDEMARKPVCEVIEIIGQNTPDYLPSARATGDLPEKTIDLVVDYGIWNLLRLRFLYENVWNEAIDNHYRLAATPGVPQMVKSIWTHVAAAL